MSNTNYKVTNGGVIYDLIQLFMYGNSGVTTGYNDPSGVDLGSIFMLKTTNTLPFNTNYVVNIPPYINRDFTTIFNGITPLSQVYSTSNLQRTSVTYVQTLEYSGLIFDYTGIKRAWNSTPPPLSTATVTFYQPINVTFLIVGGGGGGGQSQSSSNSGAGGSGGGTIYTSYQLPGNTSFNIQVGYNGGGNDNSAATPINGQCTGANGGDSIIQNTSFILTAYGGGGGGGAGVVNKNRAAGNANINVYDNDYTIFTGIIASNVNGGGGGSGGGAVSTNNDASTLAGDYGYLTYGTDPTPNFDGNKGQDGNTTTPGNGGGGYFFTGAGKRIRAPFISDPSFNYTTTYSTSTYCGNGGGGGSNSNSGTGSGGSAGKDLTGGGGGNYSGTKNGENAIDGFSGGNRYYYGNGGGGAAAKYNGSLNKGGNGGRGVVMMWWRIV